MKIIDQSYEIINMPDNLLQMIEAAGRTCYKSEDKIGCIELTDNQQMNCPICSWNPYGEYCVNTECEMHSSHKFTKTLLDRDHHAMIEFGDIIVRFVTNRGVTHELVRHRLCSFAQESTRYVRYDGNMEFIRPVWSSTVLLGQHTIVWDGLYGTQAENTVAGKLTRSDSVWFWNQAIAERDYCKLLENGWRPEQAREVLPNSLKTEIVTKTNIREWRHIFQLRCSKKAHPQIRALMQPLLAELKQKVPVVFDDIEPGGKDG